MNKGAGDATNRGHAQARSVLKPFLFAPLPPVCREVEKAGGHGSQSWCPRQVASSEAFQAPTCRSTVAVTGITDKMKKTVLWFPLCSCSQCPEAPQALRMNSEASLFRGIWQDHPHRGAVLHTCAYDLYWPCCWPCRTSHRRLCCVRKLMRR